MYDTNLFHRYEKNSGVLGLGSVSGLMTTSLLCASGWPNIYTLTDLQISFRKEKKEKKSLQSCLTLCDPVGYSPPGSSVHGILQARLLEWVAILFSRESFEPRDQTQVSCIAGSFFTIWASRAAPIN